MRIGIDIGGTFTDLCMLGHSGRTWSTKILTTPEDPSIGFVSVLARALDQHPDTVKVREIIHATTVATNAILENKTARMGLITTAGFRDVLEIGRHFRRDLYNFFLEKPPVLVPRERRIEVSERIAADGRVIRPLDERGMETAVRRLVEADVEVILVCFLHSYARPDHELRAGKMIRAHCGLPVILSHEVCAEQREYERFSTAAVHGAVMPLVRGYLGRIEARIRQRGIAAPLSVMQSSGGICKASWIAERPGLIVESGPAAGVIAAVEVGRRLGFGDLVTLDMGGTTTKASIAFGGRIVHKADYEVGGGLQGGFGTGYPLRTPVVDVVEIGTGGGSLSYVDPAGHLHVGPESAGADPGPACYGRGGTEPTITDAHCVLGRLRPDHFAGGQFPLDAAAAREAIQKKVAEPLGLSVQAAAEGIIRLANAQMARALKLVSVERGHDPRRLALVAFGGAGPMHAAELAAELGCARVIIPPEAGVQSAWGLLVSDCRRDASQTILCRADALDLPRLRRRFAALAATGERELREAGFSASRLKRRLSVDVRYVGQAYEVSVELRGRPDFSPEMVAELNRTFHKSHHRLYGHGDSRRPVEWVTLRAAVIAPVRRVAAPSVGSTRVPLAARRLATQPMTWAGRRSVCPVYHRSNLYRGDRIAGGALIVQAEATISIPPGTQAEIGRAGEIILTGAGAGPSRSR